jgi:hypothetical protein
MNWEQMALPFDDDLDIMEIEPIVEGDGRHCETCGEYAACGYDSEGRALVHTSRFDDRDE